MASFTMALMDYQNRCDISDEDLLVKLEQFYNNVYNVDKLLEKSPMEEHFLTYREMCIPRVVSFESAQQSTQNPGPFILFAYNAMMAFLTGENLFRRKKSGNTYFTYLNYFKFPLGHSHSAYLDIRNNYTFKEIYAMTVANGKPILDYAKVELDAPLSVSRQIDDNALF